MAFWDRKDVDPEDWDDRDHVDEYEKNFRAYAEEYESAGWDAPQEDGYEEEHGEFYSEEELIPEGEEYPEDRDPEEYDAEVCDDYAEDPEYDEDPEYGEDPEDEQDPEYAEDPEAYPEEEPEAPEPGSVTEQMFRGEILYEEPGEYYRETDEEIDEESYDENYEEAPDESYDDGFAEDETVDYDDPAYAQGPAPDEEDDEDDDKVGFLGMGVMEKIMLGLGFVAVFLVVIAGAMFISARQKKTIPDQTESTLPTVVSQEELSGVGSALDGISVIGGEGLQAALDARKAALFSGETQEEPEETGPAEYDEAELNSNATVSMEGISVLKDLKIKFTNSSSKKLIANVPFTLTVTDPSGKTISWTDDDQDGIIYHKNLKEGTYTIHVEALSGDKYAKYSLPADKKVEVKGEIKYEEVEVADEVLDASQVNEAVEDTARDGAGEEQESAKTDTVTFVESTQTPTYEEVLKSTLTSPLAAASGGLKLVLGWGNTLLPGTGGSFSSSTSEETDASVSDNTVIMPSEGGLALSTSTLKACVGVENTFTVVVNGLAEDQLTVASSDAGVATASIKGTTVTVTGVAKGTAVITVGSKENPDAAKTCSVTVLGSDTLLKDSSDRQLLVFEDNAYRDATYADYFNASIVKMYVVGEIKYTGWQTIDGWTYFYTADGKAVTGSQVIQGVRYEFGTDGKLNTGNGVLGIDVSKWNGTIDWNKVKSAGVNYAIIRVGYRGSSQGALIDDSRFAANIKGATAAGLKVGVYFFSQAVDEVEAVYEASMVLDRISGYKIDLPVFIDVEASGGRGDAIDKATRTAVIKAFCATVTSKGYTAGVYSNKTWLTSKIDVSALGAYKIWLAQYADQVTYTGRYDIWQYSSKGTINGISGNVDLNLSYMSY